MWPRILLALWLSTSCVIGQGISVEILDVSKNKPVGLPYYFDIAPQYNEKQEVFFLPKPDEISCNLLEMGKFGGQNLLCYRYLKGDPKDNGRVRPGENPGAEALALLISTDEKERYYAPILIITKLLTEEAAKVHSPKIVPPEFEDLSVSSVNQLNDLHFLWLRVHHGGDDPYIEHFTITPGAIPGEFKLYDLFSKADPLESLKKQGWQESGRPPRFNEDTLTRHYFLKKENKDAHYPVKYSFRDGQLHPGEIEMTSQ